MRGLVAVVVVDLNVHTAKLLAEPFSEPPSFNALDWGHTQLPPVKAQRSAAPIFNVVIN